MWSNIFTGFSYGIGKVPHEGIDFPFPYHFSARIYTKNRKVFIRKLGIR